MVIKNEKDIFIFLERKKVETSSDVLFNRVKILCRQEMQKNFAHNVQDNVRVVAQQTIKMKTRVPSTCNFVTEM